jgi:hypothetical protein
MRSSKNKIYLLCVAWVAGCVIMFLYVFKILDNSNQKLVDSFADQQQSLEVLQSQQESYKQANADLAKVQTEKYEPQDLFSQDITLVDELKTLETLSKKANVNMTLSGISGTVKGAQRAPTESGLFQIPYTILITGTLNDCVSFLQSLEHVKFVTTVPSLTLNSGTNNSVSINMTGFLYIRPQ